MFQREVHHVFVKIKNLRVNPKPVVTWAAQELDGQESELGNFDGARFEPARGCPLADNPNSTARRNRRARLASNPNPGIEPGPPRFSPKTVRPPLFWWRITDQLRPIEIGVAKRIRTVTSAFTGHYAAITP